MNWDYTKFNARAAVWTALILIAVRIAFQIRDGRWSHISPLLVMEGLLLAGLLARVSKKPS